MAEPRVITASTTEPITLAEAAENLRVPAGSESPADYPESALIRRLITAARHSCEQELEMSLVAKTMEVAQDSFYPGCIALPMGPVRSIVSVTYVDLSGDDQVVDDGDYRLDPYTGSLLTAYGVSWPSTRCDLNSVRVRYTAGYPTEDSPAEVVPAPIIQAMHLFIGHYFTNREAVDADTMMELPLGARYLLGTYRRGLGV